jgi:hypothetical protein
MAALAAFILVLCRFFNTAARERRRRERSYRRVVAKGKTPKVKLTVTTKVSRRKGNK